MLIHHRYWLAPSTLLLLWSAAPAWAQKDEPVFQLNAGYSLLTDSNPRRVPAGTEDQIGTTTLGFNFSTRQSLQQFELDLNLIDYKYQNFDHLNFTARNYNAAWRWALTPRMHGNLTSDRRESLNSYFINTDQKDSTESSTEVPGVLRTNTNTRFDGVYELDGVWRVLGGVSTSKLTSDQTDSTAPVSGTDAEVNSADMGLRYAFTSGNALTYTARTSEGNYLNDGSFNESFSQRDNELRLHWILTGNTTADISAAHISRTHPDARLDYSGLNTGVKLNWNITGKTALAAGWMRELTSDRHDAGADSYNYNSTHVRTNRFSLGPVWKASAKTVVRLNYEVAQRDYQGSPTGLDAATQRSDTLRNISLAVAWQPYKHVTLGASLQKATRTSNVANLDYGSNMATVSAQFSY